MQILKLTTLLLVIWVLQVVAIRHNRHRRPVKTPASDNPSTTDEENSQNHQTKVEETGEHSQSESEDETSTDNPTLPTNSSSTSPTTKSTASSNLTPATPRSPSLPATRDLSPPTRAPTTGRNSTRPTATQMSVAQSTTQDSTISSKNMEESLISENTQAARFWKSFVTELAGLTSQFYYLSPSDLTNLTLSQQELDSINAVVARKFSPHLLTTFLTAIFGLVVPLMVHALISACFYSKTKKRMQLLVSQPKDTFGYQRLDETSRLRRQMESLLDQKLDDEYHQIKVHVEQFVKDRLAENTRALSKVLAPTHPPILNSRSNSREPLVALPEARQVDSFEMRDLGSTFDKGQKRYQSLPRSMTAKYTRKGDQVVCMTSDTNLTSDCQSSREASPDPATGARSKLSKREKKSRRRN